MILGFNQGGMNSNSLLALAKLFILLAKASQQYSFILSAKVDCN